MVSYSRSTTSLWATSAILYLQLALDANAQTLSIFPRTRSDPVSLSIRTLDTRSPAVNTSFGAGISAAALAGDRQAYYTVIQAGGLNFRVALDTASSDLWLVSSSCTTATCKKVPSYPLNHQSPTFLALNQNNTVFNVSYADHTFASGFVAQESVQIANLTVSNQNFGLAVDSNVSLTDFTSGILGLGFSRLSSISKNRTDSLPFFANLATRGLLEYPLFALSLRRNSTGTLSLGAVDASIVTDPRNITWHQVAQFPPFGSESDAASYLEWAIPLTSISVNRTAITPIPTQGGKNPSLALFDVGSPGIFGPYQDVSRIFAAIDGSRMVDQAGQWAVPCETTVPISFTFMTATYSLLPTDYLLGPASGNPNLCLAWPMALPPNSDGIDWQLGTAFLRTVYSVFSFGINKKEPPLIGLYPLYNMTNITSLSESPADISSFFSANTATVATTLPNFVLPTPTFTTPAYTFNASVAAQVGGIVSTGLANTTYSALFADKTVLGNVTALSKITPPPSILTITVTSSGHVSTLISTIPVPSMTLGLPSDAVGLYAPPAWRLFFVPFGVFVWTISFFVWTC